MLLTEAVIVVSRELGYKRVRELLEERTPEDAQFDFFRWALCPGIIWKGPEDVR